jgi:hypothetical protein
MRLILFTVALFVLGGVAAEAAPSGAQPKRVADVVAGVRMVEPICSGCGCRGGPGYRLPNGKCASGRR